MKTEFVDVNETRKNLVVEIDSTVVDAEIDKVSRDYSKAARIPGFRPGKVPAKIVRQRIRDQILHHLAHGWIPRAAGQALRPRGGRGCTHGAADNALRVGGGEQVDAPDSRDVVLAERQALKFTAPCVTV